MTFDYASAEAALVATGESSRVALAHTLLLDATGVSARETLANGSRSRNFASLVEQGVFPDLMLDETQMSASADESAVQPDAPRVNATTAGAGESLREPVIGEKVVYSNEVLSIAGVFGERVLLYQQGRNSNYAVLLTPVSDAQLQLDYQSVDMDINGKSVRRYLEKSHPSRVYQLMEIGGKRHLLPDYQFETVKRSDLSFGKRQTEQPKAEQKRESAPPKEPGSALRAEPVEKDAARPDAAKPSDTKREFRGVRAEVPARFSYVPGSVDTRYGQMEERSRMIDGSEMKVRTPVEARSLYREVEISGQKIELMRSPWAHQQWYFSADTAGDDKYGQVKLHVTGVSSEDVARLQKELLPVLEELRKRGDVALYKTFDPNFMDANWADHADRLGSAPGPELQLSKAFTIYLRAESAELIAGALDKLLGEKGLRLDADFKAGTVGDISRARTESRRVSIERDQWTATTDDQGRSGALLDESLAARLTSKYAQLGTDSSGKLTPDALREIERVTGMKAGQLSFDHGGRLMFRSPECYANQGLYYVDESLSVRVPGEITGRPALYALYGAVELDPARVHLDQKRVEISKAAAPSRVIPSVDAVTSVVARTSADGTISREQHGPGEALAREQLEKRDRISPTELESMKKHCAVLEQSQNESERMQADCLRKTIEALEGKYGPVAAKLAHRAVLAESRAMLDRGSAGGYGKALAGGTIGIAILTGAALSWYRATNRSDARQVERAGFGR